MSMQPVPRRIVVVGAGLAGVRTCAELRSGGYDGELVLLGAELDPPYDRPPLSKAVLAGADPTPLEPTWYAGATLRLGVRATGLEPGSGAGVVRTTDGELAYDAVVLACGAAPVALPLTSPDSPPPYSLRTAADAVRLRAVLRPGARVVLVGAGWIGAEVATAAAAHGCVVTVLEAGPAPLAVAVSPAVGARTMPWYAEAGIELRTGTAVSTVDGAGMVLADGRRLAADVVCVGVGVRPDTGWLAGSGLVSDRGVLTDDAGRTNLPGVYAVGDCAARWSPRAGRRICGEHWDDALHAPAVVAGTVLGRPGSYDAVPYVWSEQFGRFLQWTGWREDGADPVVWRGDPAGPAGWAAAWLAADGRLTGLLAVDRPRDVGTARRLIAAGHRPDPSRLADPGVDLRAT